VSSAGRLDRCLGTVDAVVIGIGSMLGTGVFVVWSPAGRHAGPWLLLALALAAAVAFCNAMSMAQLASIHPESGGAYLYGRLRLGRGWGLLAGWAFIIGKTASCAAAGLAVGAYGWPGHDRAVALAAVLALTAVNLRGIAKTACVTRLLVAVVLLVLALVVATAWLHGVASASVAPVSRGGLAGVPAAAGLFFFAFAGYARIATLGEEVRDPARTIPRAIVVALACVLLVYVVVGLTLLHVLGTARLAAAATPLTFAVQGTGVVEALVRGGAVVAALGVLLPLLAGVARTVFAMASFGDLPARLSTVDARHRVPQVAQVLVGVAVLAVVAVGELQGAVAVSAGSVLTYYAVANAAALRLRPDERRWPRGLAVAGLVGCLTLACAMLLTA
jgi:APA family basic amino acid/polyamine antiporter